MVGWDYIRELPFLFAMMMDRLTDTIRQDSQWIMIFTNDIVIYSESRVQTRTWRFALERKGMKTSGSTTEYVYVNKIWDRWKSTIQTNGECRGEGESAGRVKQADMSVSGDL